MASPSTAMRSLRKRGNRRLSRGTLLASSEVIVGRGIFTLRQESLLRLALRECRRIPGKGACRLRIAKRNYRRPGGPVSYKPGKQGCRARLLESASSSPFTVKENSIKGIREWPAGIAPSQQRNFTRARSGPPG